MIEYIYGQVKELNPSFVVMENNGIGYFINISLQTYSFLSGKENQDVYLKVHQIIREDAHLLYGFHNHKEREVFRHLLSVSGVGANTARLILSSMPPGEIQQAIQQENVNALKNIKGIGAKSAQRIIIDLKDKIGKQTDEGAEISPVLNNTLQEEALSALTTLGFNKNAAQKAVEKIIKEDPGIGVEALVKESLKRL